MRNFLRSSFGPGWQTVSIFLFSILTRNSSRIVEYSSKTISLLNRLSEERSYFCVVECLIFASIFSLCRACSKGPSRVTQPKNSELAKKHIFFFTFLWFQPCRIAVILSEFILRGAKYFRNVYNFVHVDNKKPFYFQDQRMRSFLKSLVGLPGRLALLLHLYSIWWKAKKALWGRTQHFSIACIPCLHLCRKR